jgi:hypothetical protein
MNQINLIQTLYKGFSCYVPKTKKNLVLKDISQFLTNEKGLADHYFIYFDDRLGRGFRVFIQSEYPSELLQNKLLEILKNYASVYQNLNEPHQFFKTYLPFSVVPMRFIEDNDEIFTTKEKIQSIQNLLKNLNLLINQKTEEFDFSNDNQKLEFTLELLIAGVAFNQFSSLSIQQEFKRSLKSIPDYKKYLYDKYARTVENNKDAISTFKKSFALEENKHNFLSLFWERNQVEDTKKLFEIIFKVLDINAQQKCYCLYVLQNTQE